MNHGFNRCRCALISLPVTLILAGSTFGATFHVDHATGSDSDNGTTWPLAFATPQKALAAAAATGELNDLILVAEGTYYPDKINGSDSNDRDDTFTLVSGVEMKGGYEYGDVVGDQDPVGNPTILSGDIDGDDSPNSFGDSGNSRHVVTAIPDGDDPAVLDGFFVRGGYLDECETCTELWEFYGAGILVRGGEAEAGDTSPIFRNCVIEWNKTVDGLHGAGVAVYQEEASDPVDPQFHKCTFSNNNTGNAGDGAAVATWASSPIFVQCTLFNNTASGDGGAFAFKAFGDPEVINCHIFANDATNGGAAFAECTGACFPPEVSCAYCQFFPTVTLLNCLLKLEQRFEGRRRVFGRLATHGRQQHDRQQWCVARGRVLSGLQYFPDRPVRHRQLHYL